MLMKVEVSPPRWKRDELRKESYCLPSAKAGRMYTCCCLGAFC